MRIPPEFVCASNVNCKSFSSVILIDPEVALRLISPLGLTRARDMPPDDVFISPAPDILSIFIAPEVHRKS